MGHSRRLTVALVVAGGLVVAACSGGGNGDLDRQAGAPSTAAAAPTTSAPERPRGGVAVVAVAEDPDPGAPTLGGAAVRALVLPQLHVAQPDGSWAPSLLEPGSEEEAPDLGSVSFRLRPDAAWSDGSPVTADDLRRSADERFVAAVEGPDAGGRITVELTQRLPDWRRLWSGTDAVTAPADGVWGGPFVVADRTPGLEVVLHPNPSWWGTGPFLDEVRLLLIPDATTAFQMFEAGEVDVLAPPGYPARAAELEAVDGATVSTGPVTRSGWWLGLLLERDGLDGDDRRALVATVDRTEFVGSLLKDEAVVLNGFGPSPGTGPWSSVGPGDPSSLRRDSVDLVGISDEPLTGLLQRSMQQRARPVDATLELRNAEADLVQRWVAEGEYDAAIVVNLDPPTPCWVCRWSHIDEELARRADAGEPGASEELELLLRDEAFVLPLWRPRPVVAWRSPLSGPIANGYAASAAWNADQWWRE